MELAPKELVEGCKCKPVTSADLLNYHNTGLIKEMISFTKDRYGVGLASPQIGIFKRFFVMKYGGNDTYISCFNPKITFSSPQKSSMKESCLTYNKRGMKPFNTIMRPKSIKVEYQDIDGNVITLRLRGLEAKVFQHKLDHLDGITIFNRGK